MRPERPPRPRLAPALLAALLLCGPGPAGAAYKKTDSGTTTAQFLKLGADARAAGMAQAARALAEDATAVYWNPAGLAGLQRRHATVTHAVYLQDVFYDFMAYAQPVESVLGRGVRERELRTSPLGSIGVGVMYLNAGRFGELDNTGAQTGATFIPQDLAVMAAWGGSVTRNLDLGLGVKYIASRIHAAAATGAVDAGGRWRWKFLGRPAVISFSVHNAGGNLRYNDSEETLPTTVSGGAALKLTRDWSLSAEMLAPRDGRIYGVVGTEMRWRFDGDSAAALRAGYNGLPSSREMGGFTAVTAGGGWQAKRFGVDYAWTPFGRLGDIHRFTLSFSF